MAISGTLVGLPHPRLKESWGLLRRLRSHGRLRRLHSVGRGKRPGWAVEVPVEISGKSKD
jgi:hypothetical protein